jgi:hypothetical protein
MRRPVLVNTTEIRVSAGAFLLPLANAGLSRSLQIAAIFRCAARENW